MKNNFVKISIVLMLSILFGGVLVPVAEVRAQIVNNDVTVLKTNNESVSTNHRESSLNKLIVLSKTRRLTLKSPFQLAFTNNTQNKNDDNQNRPDGGGFIWGGSSRPPIGIGGSAGTIVNNGNGGPTGTTIGMGTTAQNTQGIGHNSATPTKPAIQNGNTLKSGSTQAIVDSQSSIGVTANSNAIQGTTSNPASQSQVTVNYRDYYPVAYQQGSKQGIIRQSPAQFTQECQRELGPGYARYVKEGGNVSFPDYAELNYYGQVDPGAAGSRPQTIRMHANKKPILSYSTKKHSKSYHMRAGDIFICHGTSSVGAFVGHAGIAKDSKSVLEMPGPGKRAHNTSKKTFFKDHAINAYTYVDVYRMKNRSAPKKAASYAYRKMYKKHNPRYAITTNLYHKSPSYCSKYVYLAYYWGATRKSLKYYKYNFHIVRPYGLIGNFKGHYKPKHIYTITGK